MKCFTLHLTNLKYMKVSLFEISYKKKVIFLPYSNFLRCTCMYIYIYIYIVSHINTLLHELNIQVCPVLYCHLTRDTILCCTKCLIIFYLIYFSLSILMTACSTALGLGMMPLLLYLYSQGLSNLAESVPFNIITLALIMILVPCGIGILINYRVPHYSKIITQVC